MKFPLLSCFGNHCAGKKYYGTEERRIHQATHDRLWSATNEPTCDGDTLELGRDVLSKAACSSEHSLAESSSGVFGDKDATPIRTGISDTSACGNLEQEIMSTITSIRRSVTSPRTSISYLPSRK